MSNDATITELITDFCYDDMPYSLQNSVGSFYTQVDYINRNDEDVENNW
jgi:hypothetical protein